MGTFDLETLFEKPLLIGLLGGIAAAVLGLIWLQTARREVLWVLIVVIAITGAGVVAGRLIITDREAVQTTLEDIARAVERDTIEDVLPFIHPDAQSVRQQAESELPRYEFFEVKIKSNLDITFDNAEEPSEAVAKFNVLVIGSERNGLFKDRRVPRYCTVYFRKHQGQWRVVAYHHEDAREGLLQR
jgi:hypothetical protein